MVQTYDYRYRLAMPGGHGICRIRIFRAAARTIGVATQRHTMPGSAPLAAGADTLARQIADWHHAADDGAFLWVEQDVYPAGDGPGGARESFALVTFGAVPGASPAATRRATDRPAVEVLLGQPLTD